MAPPLLNRSRLISLTSMKTRTENLKKAPPRTKLCFRSGFSIIEMLIYIAILVLMLAVVMNTIVAVTRSERVIKSLRQIEDSAVLAIERVGREVRGADEIDAGSSTLGSHPGRLVLDGLDDAGGARTVEFYLSDGRLLLKE